MKLRAAIFDLDGTLAETLADIGNAMNHTLEQFELPTHPLDAYRYFVGDGVAKLAERVLAEDRQDLCDDIVAGFKSYYQDHCMDTSRPYDGIPELLTELIARDIPIGVLSNKPNDATQEVMRSMFAQWPFTCVRGQMPGGPKKPDPSGAVAIAQMMALQPAECMFIGDTSTDMKTACNAGMYAVGVTWGFRDRDELVEHGAKTIIDHPSQLLDLL